jgi:hypothetical protein
VGGELKGGQQSLDEASGILEGVRAGSAVAFKAAGVAPEDAGGLASGGRGEPLEEKSPARERFAGVVFAGGLKDDGAGSGAGEEGLGEVAGVT